MTKRRLSRRRNEPWPPTEEGQRALQTLMNGGDFEQLALFGLSAVGAGHPAHAIPFLSAGIRYLMNESSSPAPGSAQPRLFRRPVAEQLRVFATQLQKAGVKVADQDALQLVVYSASPDRRAASAATNGVLLAKLRKRSLALDWFARAWTMVEGEPGQAAHLENFGVAELRVLAKEGRCAEAGELADQVICLVSGLRADLDPEDPDLKWRKRALGGLERAAARVLAQLAENTS